MGLTDQLSCRPVGAATRIEHGPGSRWSWEKIGQALGVSRQAVTVFQRLTQAARQVVVHIQEERPARFRHPGRLDGTHGATRGGKARGGKARNRDYVPAADCVLTSGESAMFQPPRCWIACSG